MRVECTCTFCGRAFARKPSEIRTGGGKYCSQACQYRARVTPDALATRFWAKVAKGPGINDCWIWTATCLPKKNGRGGYGQFQLAGNKMSASRASWILHHGPVPDGLFVCHDCPGGDNRRCVRPDHLFLGTARDNSEDMVRKGRSAVGDRNGSRTHPERYSKVLRRREAEALVRAQQPGVPDS